MDSKKIKKRLFFYYSLLWLFLFAALYLSYFVYFVDTTSTKSKWVGLFAGAVALLLASLKAFEIHLYDYKNRALEEIRKYFLTGVKIFSFKLIKISLFFAILLSFLLYNSMGKAFVISMVTGIVSSIFLIIISDFILSGALVKFNSALKERIGFLNKLALDSGICISIFPLGIAIVSVVVLFHNFKDYEHINGFLLGSCIVILLHNISTSISKRASLQAFDVVSGHIAQIDEYDKCNPLLMLKGISNSIFKSVNLSLELFLCFCMALISSMTIGGNCLNLMGSFMPIIIAAGGIFASIIAFLIVKVNKIKNPVKSLLTFSIVSFVFFSIATFYVVNTWLEDSNGLALSTIIGSFGALAVCFSNSNYIFERYKPAKNISNAAISGLNCAFLQTLREGFMSVVVPLFIVAASISISFLVSYGLEAPLYGLYGVSLSIVGFLSTVAVVACASFFGLECLSYKNVFNSFEKKFPVESFEDETLLSKNGYYLISLGKNFINGISILASISVLIAYSMVVELEQIDILNPYVLTSIFIGIALVFVYCSFIMSANFGCAKRLVLEVKNQFRKFPQILRFELRPDYEKCVDICAINSYARVIIYTIITVLIFYFIAFKLKIEALCGFVFGAIFASSGLVFAISTAKISAYGAKKYFESEYINIQNSSEYIVISNNNKLFELMKDLIVPASVMLIKFLAILALTLAPIFLQVL